MQTPNGVKTESKQESSENTETSQSNSENKKADWYRDGIFGSRKESVFRGVPKKP